jgi:hypothetical protein
MREIAVCKVMSDFCGTVSWVLEAVLKKEGRDMKKHLVAISLFAVAFVSSHSAPSQAAVDRTQFRGTSADVSLSQETPLDCGDGLSGAIDTSIFIEGFSSGVRSTFGNSDSQTAIVFFSEFNSCTGEFRDAEAFETPADYNQSRVNSASLSGSFDLVDFNGEAIGTLVVDLDWTGVGDTSRFNSHSTSKSGDFLFQSRSSGTFRSATVSGSVTLDGAELLGLASFADLSDNRSGDITVTH